MSAGFPLSVVVLTKNEAGNIRRCLQSVAWCAERVVVDDGSTDDTVMLAQSEGARVVRRRFDTFAQQRNWALDSADLRYPWVLMLDADEVVTEALRCEIERKLPAAAAEVAGYRMCRKTMFMDRWLKWSDGFPVWIMRLVRRGVARFMDSGHGEVPVPPVTGRLETLHEPFEHYPFSRGIGDWTERHNRYAEKEARREWESAETWTVGELFARDRAVRRRARRSLSRTLPGRPMLRFLYQYVGQLGFLDGRAGLEFCLLMAAYEGLIVLKRRELQQLSQGLPL
jgi:glycosyltransferase involved in cell wall biosynthesis